MKHDDKSTGLFSDEEEGYNLEEETKYKLKLGAKSEPASSVSDDEEESLDVFDDAEGGDELSFGDDKDAKGDNDKPFDDEPFDAGVEADEREDPEKFIQQLAGKLGTSLRKYNDERGEPDFDLEKYAINSVISATHTAEMDEEDQKDIIKKVKMSGAGDDNDDVDKDLDMSSEEEPESEKELNEKFLGKLKNFSAGVLATLGIQEYGWKIFNSITSIIANKLPEDKAQEFSDTIQSAVDYLVNSNFVGEGYTDNELDELFKKKLSKDTIELQGDEINRLKKKFPGITDKEIADMLLDPKAKADGITSDVFLTREYDLGEGYYEESWSDPMELKEGTEISDDLRYHLDNNISLGESVFRYGSDKYVELCSEVKDLREKELINLNENDEKLLEDFTNQSIIIEGETILLNLIIEDNGEYILEGDKYKGKKTNSPTRGAGGGKAYKVFVPGCAKETKSNPRGIKKITFGSGGLKAKLTNSEAKKSYNARHGCSKGKHNDKCKAGYWSCRLPRYANKLGLSGGGTWW